MLGLGTLGTVVGRPRESSATSTKRPRVHVAVCPRGAARPTTLPPLSWRSSLPRSPAPPTRPVLPDGQTYESPVPTENSVWFCKGSSEAHVTMLHAFLRKPPSVNCDLDVADSQAPSQR